MTSFHSFGLRLLIVPGGGPPDNAIEGIYARKKFSMETAHHACALAQDQISLILADKFYSSNIQACKTFAEIRHIFMLGRMPVILPSHLILTLDLVEEVWGSVRIVLQIPREIEKVIAVSTP